MRFLSEANPSIKAANPQRCGTNTTFLIILPYAVDNVKD